MARSLNKIQLLGYVGAPLELKEADNNVTYTSFSIATSEKWVDKNTKEDKERTDWHRIVAYGKTAELMTKMLKKGTRVFLEGALRQHRWEDEEGNIHYQTQIIARDFINLDKRPESEPLISDVPEAQSALQESQLAGTHSSPEADEDFSDDLPF